MATRRWYYFVPATGAPRGLVHAIERHNLDDLPGEKRVYAGREQLAAGLQDLLKGVGRVAMEYSPGNAIPYVSRVDAGTIETVRQCGASVVSSGDLAQRFEAVWTDAALATHVAAAERLYRIKDRAFDLIRQRMAAGAPLTEIEVQDAMVEWFREEGLIADTPPNVSAQENAGNPHYQATRAVHRAIRPNEGVLIDLWGKLTDTGCGLCGHHLDGLHRHATSRRSSRRRSRRCATGVMPRSHWCSRPSREGRDLRGFEVDRACRDGHRARRVRRAVHPPHRTQPRRRGARQRRAHGRLRDARRPPAAARHGLHD